MEWMLLENTEKQIIVLMLSYDNTNVINTIFYSKSQYGLIPEDIYDLNNGLELTNHDNEYFEEFYKLKDIFPAKIIASNDGINYENMSNLLRQIIKNSEWKEGI